VSARRQEDSEGNGQFESIPFLMHPRVFAALGADLVTNDVVAVIELVKNSYDAFAKNTWVRFRTDPEGGDLIEIEDDGLGMPRDIIEKVWCVVATPFKEEHPLAESEAKTRRVVGDKGLGRFSAARLGDELHFLTQAPDGPCWEVFVNWAEISKRTEMARCVANCRRYPGKSPFVKSGTRLQVRKLKGKWDDNKMSDLEDNLARLLPPFKALGDFKVFFSRPGEQETEAVEIEAPDFLSRPKYRLKGKVDAYGNAECRYRFRPIGEKPKRTKKLALAWGQTHDAIDDPDEFPFSEDRAHCGPFSFEIRAWDIAAGDTQEIAEAFDLQKSTIRKAIRAHKGISVYRDGVLVLPKSDSARDWLGLDLRRVSKVGTRLSTSQLVGYVSISAEANPHIKDTSDRERLVSRLEVAEFEEILKAAIALLENERDLDRVKREEPLKNLFAELSADAMLTEIEALAGEGADAAEVVAVVRSFADSLSSARERIQSRFVYYSRMATVGTVAQMLVHEIRNRTTAFGSFLDSFLTKVGPPEDHGLAAEYASAVRSVEALERLADTFAPLANRSFRRRKRHSVLEDQIRQCLALQRGEINKKAVRCYVPESETHVAVDPGELDAILLNLITNAVYWLGQVPKEERRIEFRLRLTLRGKRVRVWVHDSGPGVDEDILDKAFWPGVTKKPGGIGMGLTVASELVSEYGGSMSIKHPGLRGGASFAFDLPIKE